MRITERVSRAASLDSELYLHDLIARTQSMKQTAIRCIDTDDLKIRKCDLVFGWGCLDEVDSFGTCYYKINVSENVDKIDLSHGLTRKDTKAKWGSMLVVYLSPHGKGMKHKDIVSFLCSTTGLSSDELMERIPDLPILVQESGGWSKGYGFRIAKTIFDNGYIE